jgi:hypothetical protein
VSKGTVSGAPAGYTCPLSRRGEQIAYNFLQLTTLEMFKIAKIDANHKLYNVCSWMSRRNNFIGLLRLVIFHVDEENISSDCKRFELNLKKSHSPCC